MKDRRMATKPHYQKSAEGEYIFTWAITFITGAMLGAVLTFSVDVMRPAIVVDNTKDPIEYTPPRLFITLEVTDKDYYPLPEDLEEEDGQ